MESFKIVAKEFRCTHRFKRFIGSVVGKFFKVEMNFNFKVLLHLRDPRDLFASGLSE